MKILFAAGTQFPFPRLDEVVLGVAERRPEWSLVYQAGPRARLEPFQGVGNLRVRPLFDADEYRGLFADAELVVTHAGMGNILACLEQGKAFLMLPRLARLGEHRNAHQVDTAEAIAGLYGIPFHEDADSLLGAILSYDAASSATLIDGEAIRHQREAFGKSLNALIHSL